MSTTGRTSTREKREKNRRKFPPAGKILANLARTLDEKMLHLIDSRNVCPQLDYHQMNDGAWIYKNRRMNEWQSLVYDAYRREKYEDHHD